MKRAPPGGARDSRRGEEGIEMIVVDRELERKAGEGTPTRIERVGSSFSSATNVLLEKFRRWLAPVPPVTPVFVIGCQRSGTTMFLRVLNRSPNVRVYHENNEAAFADEFRLRPDGDIRRLIESSDQPVVVFKPLQDSQRTLELLDLHHNSRAIWLYRHYEPVVNSALREWEDGLMKIMERVAEGGCPGEPERAILGGLDPAGLEFVREQVNLGLTPMEGALLHWYARNRIFLGLYGDDRVLPVRYEQVIEAPLAEFRRVFDFIGEWFSPRYVDLVESPRPPHLDWDVREELETECRNLLHQLEVIRTSRAVSVS